MLTRRQSRLTSNVTSHDRPTTIPTQVQDLISAAPPSYHNTGSPPINTTIHDSPFRPRRSRAIPLYGRIRVPRSQTPPSSWNTPQNTPPLQKDPGTLEVHDAQGRMDVSDIQDPAQGQLMPLFWPSPPGPDNHPDVIKNECQLVTSLYIVDFQTGSQSFPVYW